MNQTKMAAQPFQPRPAETVRKVAELALSDALEITMLIALMEGQNTGGANSKLNEAGAGAAARILRNALIARLVTLVARAYATAQRGDLHLRVAACLLQNNETRQIFESGNGGEDLAAFNTQWIKCRGDHRLPPIKVFRDKFTVHLGEPKDISETTYRDLFAFGAATAKAMELLALATGHAVKPLNTDPGLLSSPVAFWAPWKRDLGRSSWAERHTPLPKSQNDLSAD
jgi:hypothetical protein